VAERSLHELAPVHYGREERGGEAPRSKIGLCLSGGGFRAMLFHTGALWRLDEAGWLPRLDRISSVSGGSIAAGVLAVRWDRLRFRDDGRAQALQEELVEPLRRLAARTLDVRAMRGLLIPGSSVADQLGGLYRRRLYGAARLGELPGAPTFVFNTTDLLTGGSWPFVGGTGSLSGAGAADDDLELAAVVAASSAYPPFLSPARPRLPGKPVLSDGGVYDNLGLDQVWKRCGTVLISDGGRKIPIARRVATFWPVQNDRVVRVIDQQVRTLRKQQAIGGYALGLREGAYWGIRSQLANFPAESRLDCPPERTAELAEIKTRLKRLAPEHQERLINWGYAMADVALRSWVDESIPAATELPYPKRGV
jgi:NTE family protein